MSTEHNGAIQALAGCLTQGLVAYSEQILAAQPRVFVQQVDTGSVIAVLPQGKHRSVAAPHGDASARAHTGANRVPSLLPRCLFHARPSLACFILNTSLLFRPSPSPPHKLTTCQILRLHTSSSQRLSTVADKVHGNYKSGAPRQYLDLAVSPSGQFISALDTHQLTVWHVQSGEIVTTADVAGLGMKLVEFSENDSIFAVVGPREVTIYELEECGEITMMSVRSIELKALPKAGTQCQTVALYLCVDNCACLCSILH